MPHSRQRTQWVAAVTTAARQLPRLRTLLRSGAATWYGFLTRASILVTNIVIIFLLARFLSVESQGYFYTFRSVLGLQVFFELGLTTALSAFFSHEFAHLHWGPAGEIAGMESNRLRCLAIFEQAERFFRWVSVGFVLVVAPAGYYFFAAKPEAGVAWRLPWLLATAAVASFLYFTPHMALVMGSGEVAQVYRVWLFGALTGGGLACVLLVAGYGLFAVMALSLGNTVSVVWFLRRKKPRLFRPPLRIGGEIFSWRRELWPMQWRLAVSWVSGYFIFYLFTPILFQYQGAAAAGRMGMTLSASNAVLSMCIVVVAIGSPKMGNLIALRRFPDLDRLYRRTTWATIALAVLGGAVGAGALYLLQSRGWLLGSRFIPWWTASLIFLGAVGNAYINSAAVYLRAHKAEPLMWQSVATAVAQGSATWWAGANYGALGEAVGYLLVTALFAVPIVYLSQRYYRRVWHAAPGSGQPVPANAALGS